MKILINILFFTLFSALFMEAKMDDVIKNMKWLGHASLLIKIDNKNIYIDPWKIKDVSQKADIILVTHSHFDHYSEEDIKKISTQKTFLYSTEDVISKTSIKNKKIIKPFEKISIDNIEIEGFPAYNLNKDFHPKKNNWLGFIIRYADIKIYIAGDSDVIEEAKKLSVDIAILPIGGTYTMNEKEAAELVNIIKPKVVIPIHWGDIVGSTQNLENFKKAVGTSVKIVVLK